MAAKKAQFEGLPLKPNAAAADDYAETIMAAVRRMHEETKREMRRVFLESPPDEVAGFAADEGSPVVNARIALNAIRNKYDRLFAKVAKRATKRMIARTLKACDNTAKQSLRSMGDQLKLDTNFLMSDWMQEIIRSSTTEAVGLIKLIPAKYHNEVQGVVMRSITNGDGLKELVPALTERYEGNIKHARNVAMDQTRKAHSSMSAERMKQAGIKEFRWKHTGGTLHPRKDHIALNGKIFSYDDPPEIGVMYGQKVKGLPALMPFCRCLAIPIANFDD